MAALPQILRASAVCMLTSAASFLGLGAILYRAAFATGADSNYFMPMTWWSAFRSVVWPPTNLPYLPLIGVAALTIFTAFIFFRMPRAPSTLILFLQAVVAYFVGGSLGFFFLRREFETYHFAMDAERLGENWFTYESVAIWSVAAFVLAVLRIIARVSRPADKPQVSPQTATATATL
jgi:hypothetical protein